MGRRRMGRRHSPSLVGDVGDGTVGSKQRLEGREMLLQHRPLRKRFRGRGSGVRGLGIRNQGLGVVVLGVRNQCSEFRV